MQSWGKWLKGKGMSISEWTGSSQSPWVQRDRRIRTKYETGPTGPLSALKVESIHLGHFVVAVFAGVTEARVEAAGLFGQGPDQAFASGEGLGLTAENLVFEGERSVNPLPASGFESRHYV